MSGPPWTRRARHMALSTALLGLTGCGRAEPETYLVPEGYAGPVYVVQEQPGGEPERYEDGRRLYVVPADGLLLTQFSANTGVTDERFFSVGPTGERREIVGRSTATIPDTPQSRADPAVVVHGGAAGAIGDDDVPYREFVVGTRAEVLDGGARGTGGVLDALQRRGVAID